MLFYLISSSRRLWRDGQTNLTINVAVVSRTSFPEEPPGLADDDLQYFVADAAATPIFLLKLQKASENASCSGYQIRMWRCNIKHKKIGSCLNIWKISCINMHALNLMLCCWNLSPFHSAVSTFIMRLIRKHDFILKQLTILLFYAIRPLQPTEHSLSN